MSREIREKPRGKGGTIKRGRNVALELARKRAVQASARVRDQAKIEQDREQPESFGNEQTEDGAQHGAVLAEHCIERTVELAGHGAKKLNHAGKEHRPPPKERRQEPEEYHRSEPREPEDRIREKPVQSERVGAENDRPSQQKPQTKVTAPTIRNTASETPVLRSVRRNR